MALVVFIFLIKYNPNSNLWLVKLHIILYLSFAYIASKLPISPSKSGFFGLKYPDSIQSPLKIFRNFVEINKSQTSIIRCNARVKISF